MFSVNAPEPDVTSLTGNQDGGFRPLGDPRSGLEKHQGVNWGWSTAETNSIIRTE